TSNSAHVSLEPDTRRARILSSPGVRSEGVALVSTFQRQQIRQWRSVVDQNRTQDGVSGISPQITGSAFLIRGEAVQPVSVTGLEPEGLDVISPISSRIVAGSASMGADGVLVGERLAEELGLSANQPVLLRTDRGAERLLTIRGVYRTGLESLDSRVLFLTLQTARPLFRLPEGVTN
ncbi:ABC transporter permease, partial [Phenylobacterium kunshanense]